MIFTSLNWDQLPSLEVVIQQLKLYRKCNNIEHEKLKAGKSCMHKLKTRNGRFDQFAQLTENSIFWRGRDEKLALQIEALLIKALKTLGICANVHGDHGGTGGFTKQRPDTEFIVYLTHENENLWHCPVLKCLKVCTAEGWLLHTVAHPIYEEAALLNRALKSKGLEEVVDENLMPIAVGHTTKWQDTGLPLFKPLLICELCGHRSAGQRNYDFHINMLSSSVFK